MPTSQNCLKKIESELKGNWFVLVCEEEDDNFDFYCSFMEENTVIFNYKKIQFQVCKLN